MGTGVPQAKAPPKRLRDNPLLAWQLWLRPRLADPNAPAPAALVRAVADMLLDKDQIGGRMCPRSLKRLFARVGREASLKFLVGRRLSEDIAARLHDMAAPADSQPDRKRKRVPTHGVMMDTEDAPGPSVAEGTSDEETVHVDDESASARPEFDQTPGSKEAIMEMAGA